MKIRSLVFLVLSACLVRAQEMDHDAQSSFWRGVAAQMAAPTDPDEPRIARQVYPETEPHICLAFLSCCGNTDLLNHTMAAAIRHMEEDEPSMRYEVIWVDNGSGPDLTTPIRESYQIERALTLPQNAGMAYGMNLLIFNLCQSPYILLLEEDWLYLDHLVAEQTPERKRAITTAVAFLEGNKNLTSFDGRHVMGVFLRPEAYNGFLSSPFAHDWASTTVDLSSVLDDDHANNTTCDVDLRSTPVDYQIFCADSSFSANGFIWGSYTNGAGLYSRAALSKIGRMYGEPGDTFHDRYVEVNYAYRAGLQYCHAAIRLGDCRDVGKAQCTAAFYHIGGGRGTRPRTAVGSKCANEVWAFYGTALWDKYMELKQGEPICSEEDLQEWRDAKASEADSAQYRKEQKEINAKLFQMERAKREEMRMQAHLLRTTDKNVLRQKVKWLAGKSDDEIAATAEKMAAYADSPHPVRGFWDSHGRPIQQDDVLQA